MYGATRRGLLIAGLITSAAACDADAAPMDAAAEIDRIETDLKRYVDFGPKPSGGRGDIGAGEWMESRLSDLRFGTTRQVFDAPWFEPTSCELTVGASSTPLRPVPIVAQTGPEGLTGRLAVFEPWSTAGELAGAIALIPLPYARWSTAMADAVRKPVAAAIAGGAVGVVLITTGPTGEALALNVPGDKPMFDKPVAIMAPRAATPFLRAAGSPARLRINGVGGQRPAFNLIGRLDRGKGRWLVVSTPRSGWGVCGGERGPGVAIWLELAHWASASDLPVNLAFVANSGHEYENLGAEKLLGQSAPPPADTAFWLHLGANIAARDWHEFGGAGLSPLPSADPQRILVTSPRLVGACRAIFAGQPGLESPYPSTVGASGELGPILAAGYGNVAGVFGAHRFHHAQSDDMRCVEPALVAAASNGFKRLIRTAVGTA